MIIIGITGTNGSGKGTVVNYLVEKKGFTHYAARAFLTKALIERNIPVDRSAMRLIANEFRAQYEPAYIVKNLYEQAVADGCKKVVIESVRNLGEAKFLKSLGATLIAVDADQMLRYTRVQARRSVTDQVDFLTFIEHEEREMRSAGAHDMSVREVMGLADAAINNDGSLSHLHRQIEEVLTNIK